MMETTIELSAIEVKETKMINRLSNRLTFFLLQQNIILVEDSEVYTYGFEYILSMLFNLIGIFAIAMVTGSFFEGIGYLVGFALLRSVAGGYHANSHNLCMILSFFLYAINLLLIQLLTLSAINSFYTILVITGVSIILIFRYAPVDHPNKPFSTEEYSVFKRRSRKWVGSISLLLFIGVFLLPTLQTIWISIALGSLTTALSVFVAKIKKEEINYGKN